MIRVSNEKREAVITDYDLESIINSLEMASNSETKLSKKLKTILKGDK